MVDMRQAHVQKMKDIKRAIAKTKSPYLKRDYSKALRRLQKELRVYDCLHKYGARC